MNDEHFQRTVGSWLRDEDPAPPDSLQSARQVAARLPLVRQQSRWWPLPLLRRTPTMTRATDTTEYQPSSVLATNGQSPSMIGRTQPMISPVKVSVAVAIVFAIGGAYLSTQPFSQQERVAAPAAPVAELAEPVEFTAVFSEMTSAVRLGSGESVGGVWQQRGDAWAPPMLEVSDPRLDGKLTYSEDYDGYGSNQLGTVTYRIVTDDGAWQGSTVIRKKNAGYGDSSVLLAGEGAYDGLYAWMDTSDWGAIKGVIFPAPPPAAPAPPPVE